MENISHFLRACESPPFNLQSHDRFLTVDLFEVKDPAQVIQCLGAFSRVANSLFPETYPRFGPQRGGAMSPTHTGASDASNTSAYGRNRGFSNSSQASSPPPKPPRPASQAHTGGSSILYAGYMGGANQGNQGLSFGSRRQITTPAPYVPSLAEKERKRREKVAEDERLRLLAEDAERKRRIERQAEEEREKIAEERRWEEEARRLREEEKQRVERQKREWEEQERKWKADEEARVREERDAQTRVETETQRKRGLSNTKLRGQYYSQYQAEEKVRSRQSSYNDPQRAVERERIDELERQLQEAKERERQYEEERIRREEKRADRKTKGARSRSRSRPRPAPRAPSPLESNVSWVGDEREYLRSNANSRKPSGGTPTSRPLPESTAPTLPNRPLPEPTAPGLPNRPLPEPNVHVGISRPLPDPNSYSNQAPTNRTDRFLAQNQVPVTPRPENHYPTEIGMTSESERRAEETRRIQSQAKTKAGGWASKSLLEREMERERERQREWEEVQKQSRNLPKDPNAGVEAGQSWDVNQYGYTGGDSQNRVGTGIGLGGRRQIIGPRPPP
jgi:transgelin